MKKYTLELTSKYDDRLVFEVSPIDKSVDGIVASIGTVKFGGKLLAATSVMTADIFTVPRKPKPALKMKAYVLAYHLALIFTKGLSNNAQDLACEWMGVGDSSTIRRAIRDYKFPKNAIKMIFAEHVGIMVLLEPNKIFTGNGKLSYSGKAIAWKFGDVEALEGHYSFENIDDAIIIPSQLPVCKNKLPS